MHSDKWGPLGSIFFAMCRLGVAPVLGALSAVDLGFLINDAILFPQRLATLRKERALTQRVLSDAAGVHVTQLRRYEAGTSQPTLDVLRKLAIALRVSADRLLFEQDERDPNEPELRYQFEAVEKLDPQEIEVIKSVLDGILLKHQAKQVAARSAG